MVKHNNVTPNVHFRKWWQRYVKTWFDQPGKKKARRLQRQKKAAAIAPLPLDKLRPLVRPPTQRYNIKIRAGRGFTLHELKAAGLSKKVARTLGVCVDHRRKSRSAESLNLNVYRLQQYLAKMALIPRNGKLRKGFGGMPDDCKAEEMKNYQQANVADVMPIVKDKPEIEVRAVTEEEKGLRAYASLRKALCDEYNTGRHKKKLEAEAAKAAI